MTISTDMIDAMIAAGATAEVIAAAWKASIAKDERSAENRRAQTRERVKAHRARNACNALQPVTPVTKRGFLDGFPLSPAPLTPILNPSPKVLGAADAAPARPPSKKPRLVNRSLEEWLESENLNDIPTAWGDWAVEDRGLSVQQINDQWDLFRDYWRAHGTGKGRKTDWHATWRNWIRKNDDFKTERRN